MRGRRPQGRPNLSRRSSMPIERAVPAMLRMADSTSVVFMSCIFCLASSSSCLRVTLPTLILFGSFEPAAGLLLGREARRPS
jgi:hypothetical protein